MARAAAGKAAGQTLVVADRKLDLTRLSMAELNELQRGPLACPRCRAPLTLSFAKGSPQAKHAELCGHEAEDAVSYGQRLALREQLQAIFREAVIEPDVDLSGEIGRPCLADLALITPTGARLVVFLWGREEHTKPEVIRLRDDVRAAGLHPLWMLDGRRIRRRPGEEQTELRPLTVKKTETGLLAIGQPLIYIGPEPGRIYRAYLPRPVVALAHDGRVKSIGQLKTAIRPYRLGQLRVREGRWAIETSPYDPPLPPQPELPKRLRAMLGAERPSLTR